MVKYIITIEVEDRISTSIKFRRYIATVKDELMRFTYWRKTKLIDIKTTIKIVTNE